MFASPTPHIAWQVSFEKFHYPDSQLSPLPPLHLVCVKTLYCSPGVNVSGCRFCAQLHLMHLLWLLFPHKAEALKSWWHKMWISFRTTKKNPSVYAYTYNLTKLTIIELTKGTILSKEFCYVVVLIMHIYSCCFFNQCEKNSEKAMERQNNF